MKALRFLTIVSGLLLLTGCSQSDEMECLSKQDASKPGGHRMPTRSLEDAIGIAAEWFRMQSPTRSDADNTVGNVELLTRLRPGESVPDTLLYLINYAGDRSFAIVGAPMAADNMLMQRREESRCQIQLII